MEQELIENNPITLATITKDSKPNQVVVAFAKMRGDLVIITDNYMSQTVEDINNNPAVCLAVWDNNWNGIKILGSAEYHTAGEWFDFVKKIPENNDTPCKGALVVKIDKVIKLK